MNTYGMTAPRADQPLSSPRDVDRAPRGSEVAADGHRASDDHADGDILVNLGARPLGDSVTPLLVDLGLRLPGRLVHLSVDDPDAFDQRNGGFLREHAPTVRLVRTGSRAHRRALARSTLVFLTDPSQLAARRLVDRDPDRVYVRIYHGLITKAYGRLRPAATSRSGELRQRVRTAASTRRVDVHCVGSRIEAFFRAAAEGGDPSRFHVTNDPRYPRALHLERHPEDSWLSPAVREELEGLAGTLRVLYAPTHKDHIRETTILPFPDLDPEALRAELAEAGIVLFLRYHPREEARGLASDLVDGATIRALTTEAAPSLTEALPFLDVAVTDYSSIYMDFVLLDRPVVFVRDAWEEFAKDRGLAFDHEDYFPGPTVSTTAGFIHTLRALRRGEDDGREQRAFVRRALFPAADADFLTQLADVPGCANALGGAARV